MKWGIKNMGIPFKNPQISYPTNMYYVSTTFVISHPCRINLLVERGVPSVLSACSSADSERTREFLARSYFGIVSNDEGLYLDH